MRSPVSVGARFPFLLGGILDRPPSSPGSDPTSTSPRSCRAWGTSKETGMAEAPCFLLQQHLGSLHLARSRRSYPSATHVDTTASLPSRIPRDPCCRLAAGRCIWNGLGQTDCTSELLPRAMDCPCQVMLGRGGMKMVGGDDLSEAREM